jgi:hypothetical protein
MYFSIVMGPGGMKAVCPLMPANYYLLFLEAMSIEECHDARFWTHLQLMHEDVA